MLTGIEFIACVIWSDNSVNVSCLIVSASFLFCSASIMAVFVLPISVAASIAGFCKALICSGVKSSYLNGSPFNDASHSSSVHSNPFFTAIS